MPMIPKIALRILCVLAFGAMIVSVSEFWFYEVDEEVDNIGILLAYSLLGYLFLAICQRFSVSSTAGFVVSASLLGILIEGVPVPVVYTNLPFSIVWTSLAWHAMITVGCGWVLMRRVLESESATKAAAYNTGFGAFLGAWNYYMWNAQEIEGTQEVVFQTPVVAPFVSQFLIGYALFLSGHMLFDRFFPRNPAFTRAEHLGLWALALAISAFVAFGLGLVMLYPVFLLLVAMCLLVLRREAEVHTAPTYVAKVHARPMPGWRFALTGFIPLGAIVVYVALAAVEAKLEANVYLILTAGPVSACFFIWALVATWRQKTVIG